MTRKAWEPMSNLERKQYVHRIIELEHQRGELLEALREIVEGYEAEPSADFDWLGWYERACRALGRQKNKVRQ